MKAREVEDVYIIWRPFLMVFFFVQSVMHFCDRHDGKMLVVSYVSDLRYE